MEREERAELIERLAAIEHDRWADWHRHAVKNWNVAMVSRWNGQAETLYAELSESEKESDRREVRRYWPLIESALLKAKAEGIAEERKRCAEIAEYHAGLNCGVHINNETAGRFVARRIQEQILAGGEHGKG